MPSRPRLSPLLFAAAVLLLSACHLPAPATRPVLHISASGAYTLDGAPVPADALNGALAAKQVPGSDLLVQIIASPQADIRFVKSAVQASKLAHAGVTFAEDAAP